MASTAVYPSTKTCTKCGEEQPASAFSRRTKSADGLEYWCRSCSSKRYKAWIERPGNREKVRDNWKRFDGKSRGFAGYLRQSSPCQLCGESSPDCLDFHHVDPSTKVLDVSDAKHVREVIAEAQKCVLICKDCHQGIHHGRIDADRLHPLSPEWIDDRFTEYARDFTLRNG